MKLMRQVKHIDYQETAGELGALLLEASLVKKHMPIYNRRLRRQLCYFLYYQIFNLSGCAKIESSIK